MQTESFPRRKLFLLIAHHKYAQSPEDGAKHFFPLSLGLLSVLAESLSSSSLQSYPAPINISIFVHFHLFFLLNLAKGWSFFMMLPLEDKNIYLCNTAHFTKHDFLHIVVQRLLSFQGKGWTGTQGMKVPEKHTLSLYP